MTAGAVKLYQSANLAIVVDVRNPFLPNQVHPEWRHPFWPTITNPAVQKAINQKLKNFKKLVIYYSRVLPKHEDVLALCGWKEATVYVLSSVGEHDLTPWLVIHNIGHTLMSRHIKVKKEVIALLGQREDFFAIKPLQHKLVICASSKDHQILNINELINELFTTWVWHGKTQSKNKKLAKYCDEKFKALWEEHRNKITSHRYRQPVTMKEMAWLKDLVS